MKEEHSAEKNRGPRTTSTAWLGLARREITDRRSVRIRILWGRVAILLGLGLGFLWLGKSAGLYYFFKEVRDFRDVSFFDMILYPANRGAVRVEQGKYQIAQGQEAIERGDFRRAFALLREGVARAPAEIEGRMLLVEIYAGWRPDLAVDIILDGVEYGKHDPDYLRLLNALLLAQKKDRDLLDLTADLLAEDLPEDVQRQLYLSRAQAAIFLGEYDVLRTVFEESDLDTTLDGLLLGTRFYEQTGRSELAVGVLLSVINRFPEANLNPIYQQLVTIYKSMGEYDSAREAALELVIRNPLDWRPRIYLIDILSVSDRLDRRDREIEALLRQHRGNEEAMLALAQMSAGYGNVEAASRLYEIALENGYSLGVFTLTLAEAYISAGMPGRAVQLCNELVREDPTWLTEAEASFNAIRSLAYYSSGDEELGALYLNNFLESRRATAAQLAQASESFDEAGFPLPALRMLEEAYERNASDEIVLARLIDLEMRLGAFFAIEDHLNALFELRRPGYERLREIRDRLTSDRFLYTSNRSDLLDELDRILQERTAAEWEIWQRASG